ncbi:MAG TPA: hypothetical protein VOA78_04030 [Candidatus Dormibacteraeota bacterium]|nr:hypothetical protein [Candidatus Dormibacteraeota bacterium]
MRSARPRILLLLVLFSPSFARAQAIPPSGGDFSQNPDATKLPTDVIMVKGAWSSASDSTTPVPESGGVTDRIYINEYFRLAYPLSAGWTQKYTGPPPSDTGHYVLAQIRPADALKATTRGSILITAQDLFFTPSPATNALELINYSKSNLQADYKVERPPGEVSIAGHSFLRFDYGSPVADLHWHVLATQIRCHVLQFVFTTHDSTLAESLIQEMDHVKLPPEASPSAGSGGGDVPVCIKDYASDENVTERIDPVFTERRFNPVPVRILIGKEGQVKHIHFLSAFPEQAKAITDALMLWRFRPYLRDGQPVEVETGIMFGRAPRRVTPSAVGAVSE